MGAKLSKKKKGYCLGAGKDGESTETTEVEQKETENQEGQKDAAEPNEEKPPIDQSENNAASELNDLHLGVEVTSSETRNEDLNKDQRPESKSSTEQVKVEDKNQSKSKVEHVETKPAAPDQACEKKTEVKSPSEEKPKAEHEVKETPSVDIEKPTPESNPVIEPQGSDAKQPDKSLTDKLALVQNEVAVKEISALVVEIQKTPVETVQSVLENAAEESAETKEPEKSEKTEPSEAECKSAAPVLKESEAVVETVLKSLSVTAVIETEVAEPTLSEPAPVAEAAKPESAPVSDIEMPKSEPAPALESALSASVPEQPALNENVSDSVPKPVQPTVIEEVQETKPVEITATKTPPAAPETDHKSVPCSESEQISEIKQISSEPLPPKSNEVPESTTEAEENAKDQGSLGSHDQGTDVVQENAHSVFSAEEPSEIAEEKNVGQTPVIQNGPSEQPAQEQVDTQPVAEVLDIKKVEHTEDHVSDTLSKGQDCHLAKEDGKSVTEEALETKNENGETVSQGINTALNSSQHYNSEGKIENHEMAVEDIRNERNSPAPENLDKHAVGNGLPLKEEILVNLENRSDKELYEMNGQSDNNEIQVCNE